MNSFDTDYDAIVVGGGPAGLSAALWLGRYRRKVVVLDSGKPRNDPTWAVHGYPGIIDPPPHELRRILIDQATEAGAEWRGADVARITGEKNDFTVHLEDGSSFTTRRIILAYGRIDNLPEVEGTLELYGHSVFHCPDCDGPTVIGKRVAVYGWTRGTAIHALYMLTWADSVVMLTDGHEPDITRKAYKALARYNVRIYTEKVERLRSVNGCLVAADLEGRNAVPMDYLFFNLGSPLATDLANQLGCKRDKEKNLAVNRAYQTSVPGIFAAGDIAGPPYLVVSAAAQGVTAAISVHRSLLPPDMEL